MQDIRCKNTTTKPHKRGKHTDTQIIGIGRGILEAEAIYPPSPE